MEAPITLPNRQPGEILTAAKYNSDFKLVADGLYAPTFYVEKYGILPTNTGEENHAALANLAVEVQQRGGGTIHFGPGTFDFSDGITIEQNGVRLEGENTNGATGATGTVIRCTNLSGDIIHVLDATRWSISRLGLSYSGTAAVGTAAVRVTNSVHGDIDSCSIWPITGTTIETGVIYETTPGAVQQTWANRIRHSFIIAIKKDGIFVKGANATDWAAGPDIEACLIYNCESAGINCRDFTEGIYIRSATEISNCTIGLACVGTDAFAGLHNIIISGGVVFDANFGPHIYMKNVDVFLILTNWFSWIDPGVDPSYGIVLDTGCFNGKVIGNNIQYSTNGAIFCDGASVHIMANDMYHNPLAGTGTSIHLGANSAACKVLGNTGRVDLPPVDLGTGNWFGPNLFSDNLLYFGDLEFGGTIIAGAPSIAFDQDDYLRYNRGANSLDVIVNSVPLGGFGGTFGAGDTSLYLWDPGTAAIRRVTIDVADLGSGSKRYLYLA